MKKELTSKLLTPYEAAEFLSLKPETLAVWRCTGRYPLPFVRMGRRIRYRAEDLEAFILSQSITYQP